MGKIFYYIDKFKIYSNPYSAAEDANAIVVCTEWDIFKV